MQLEALRFQFSQYCENNLGNADAIPEKSSFSFLSGWSQALIKTHYKKYFSLSTQMEVVI
eukprot:TRINITY_DN8396_c0_g1_i1.p2 TRINITY_DN8396_c0_g1~~TRINITY_DN8396_c0_g1_i1.p2  ORF type:complete len:60 (+),score=6.67 TRINITY_DN8396_c0_g1_i1:285-464(+)